MIWGLSLFGEVEGQRLASAPCCMPLFLWDSPLATPPSLPQSRLPSCPLHLPYSVPGIVKVLLSILLVFLAKVSGRPLPCRDGPFSFCGWAEEPAMKSGASLPTHENTHFPWECSSGFQVGWGLCIHSAQHRNSRPPPCEYPPCLSFLWCVTFLSISLSLRNHLVDLLLSNMPNIQERRSESASCWVKTAPSSCLLSSGADC